MNHPYVPGDAVLALHGQGDGRRWVPGVVRSLGPRAAKVEIAGDLRRVELDRLRLGAAR